VLKEVDEGRKSGHVARVVYTSPISMCTAMTEANDLAARLGGVEVKHEKV
jgi:hypothetical protein